MRVRLVVRGLLRAPAFMLASTGTIALAVCLALAESGALVLVSFSAVRIPARRAS